MRKKVVSKIIGYIKSKKEIDSDMEEKLIYGIESIYILVTKLFVIFILAFFLGIFKEMIIFLLLFNGIRTFAFGLHATKSITCLIVSSITFLALPYVCSTININIIVKYIMSIICIISIYKYSPADTYKRPLINKKRRFKFKIISTIIAIVYVTLSFYSNSFISNCLLFSLLLEVIFISPITYKIFKLPYNNYLKYEERNDENVFC